MTMTMQSEAKTNEVGGAINPRPTTSVVNLKSGPHDVYIGRAGHGHDGYFGNPYRVEALGGRASGRQQAISRYRHLFNARIQTDPEFRRRIETLRGKRLGCFCKPDACHGDVIAEYLDREQ